MLASISSGQLLQRRLFGNFDPAVAYNPVFEGVR
jgi:hypothetical protein